MKKRRFHFFILTVSLIILSAVNMQPANAYMVKYKEDWYRLYHIHYQYSGEKYYVKRVDRMPC